MPTSSNAERRLLTLPRFADAGAAAYKPGLERMRALLAALGDPHEAFPSVHVAGTNGKGSTASFAASVAHAAGLRVGLHTSPHLVTLRERMRVDGRPAPPAWLEDAVDRWGGAVEALRPNRQIGAASFFEATVALSFLYFAEENVDLAVVEVGLGGRLDATNVLVPLVSVVTHVGLDHTDLLGGTRPEIAREKAGIAKPGVPLLHAVADADTRAALEAEARGRGGVVEAVRETCRAEPAAGGVRLATPERDYGEVALGLPGPHQAWNAALAVRAVERTGLADVGAAAVRAGLADVARRSGLRGRGEAWGGDARVALDVAHNADGWRAALGAVAVPEGGRLWVLAGTLADKDAGALGALLARPAGLRSAPPAGPRPADARPALGPVLAVGLAGGRALSAEALAAALRAGGADAEPAATVAGALRRFRDHAGPADRLLVTGSHQTVAAVLTGEP